ncbi:phospholipase D family protein [Citrobacter cronae]|uniref:phospholipase D family nuclease n=1 Tax=Citrobacter cronae TaxID=1748967 RepID=UPI0021D0A416|nr:phospholipase D family protein [Citrobacter cronae]
MSVKSIAMAALLCVAGVSATHASMQVGFSPEGSARALVLDSINHAQRSIDMMAYSFQSADIIQALVNAEKRGVVVRAVIDKKRNRGKVSQHAIAYATANGVTVRLDGHYHIQHDKVMIIDGDTLETGSFNFAKSAEFENSENVLVIRGEPAVVAQYQAHFDSRWKIANRNG